MKFHAWLRWPQKYTPLLNIYFNLQPLVLDYIVFGCSSGRLWRWLYRYIEPNHTFIQVWHQPKPDGIARFDLGGGWQVYHLRGAQLVKLKAKLE